MPGRIDGKISMVTGGGRGLGAAECRLFAREGATVIVADIEPEPGGALAVELSAEGARAEFVTLDVTDEDQWDAAIATVIDHYGRLDILVNNAGIAIPGTAEDTTLADWRRTMAVNLDGVFLGTRGAIRAMKQTGGGSIINISSIEGIIGEPAVAAYNASKGGVRIFTKSAALHCAREGYGIRVNSVHPSFVATDMVANAVALMPDPEAFQAEVGAKHPMGRLATAEEIANGVLFLASDDASYMTGSELVVDGGYTAQ